MGVQGGAAEGQAGGRGGGGGRRAPGALCWRVLRCGILPCAARASRRLGCTPSQPKNSSAAEGRRSASADTLTGCKTCLSLNAMQGSRLQAGETESRSQAAPWALLGRHDPSLAAVRLVLGPQTHRATGKPPPLFMEPCQCAAPRLRALGRPIARIPAIGVNRSSGRSSVCRSPPWRAAGPPLTAFWIPRPSGQPPNPRLARDQSPLLVQAAGAPLWLQPISQRRRPGRRHGASTDRAAAAPSQVGRHCTGGLTGRLPLPQSCCVSGLVFCLKRCTQSHRPLFSRRPYLHPVLAARKLSSTSAVPAPALVQLRLRLLPPAEPEWNVGGAVPGQRG